MSRYHSITTIFMLMILLSEKLASASAIIIILIITAISVTKLIRNTEAIIIRIKLVSLYFRLQKHMG